MRAAFLGAALGWAAMASGCVPFLSPPLRVDTGIGAQVGRDGATTTAAGVEELRVGMNFLDLEPSLTDRRFDVSAGYVRDFGGAEGAYAEADVAPYVHSTDDRTFRVWLGIQPRLLLAEAPDWLDGSAMEAGIGAAMRASTEWSWDLGSGRGFAGQAALGPYAELAYDEVGPLAVTTFAAGVTVHLPMIAGVIPLGRRPCCCR